MSPPKLSLSGKEPLKVPADEVPAEKTEGGELPSIITMETDRRVNVHRSRVQRKRTRRIICCAVFVIVLAVTAIGILAMYHRMRRHHRKHWDCKYGDKQLPEHVRADHDKQLIWVDHDRDEDTQASNMQMLHEYNRRMVAYKDNDKKICYIDRLDETFEEGYERWQSYEKHDRKDSKALRVISKPIEIDVLTHICDVHITAHCSDGESVWVMEIEKTEVTKDMRVVYV